MNFQEHLRENARLVILRALAEQTDYRLNETLIETALDSFGHRFTNDQLRNELRWLENDASAVKLVEAGSVYVATITETGLDHVNRKRVLEGVARPRPEG